MARRIVRLIKVRNREGICLNGFRWKKFSGNGFNWNEISWACDFFIWNWTFAAIENIF